MKIRKVKQKLPIIEHDGEVRMPIVEYQAVATVNEGRVFTGRTMQVPTALFEYLSGNEMRVFAIILRHNREHGCCLVRIRAMAQMNGCTHIAISNILSRLQKMGIVYCEAIGKKRNKLIDWKAIEVLDKMSTTWRPGGLRALRKKLKDKNIYNITPDNYRDIRAQYEINNDPIENEEYD